MVCEVCSVKGRRRLCHETEVDNQKCIPYRDHCVRCACDAHRTQNCHFVHGAFPAKSGCSSWGFELRAHERITSDSTYGTFTCSVKNCLHFAVCCFKHEQCRSEMTNDFSPMQAIMDIQQFVSWLRAADNEVYIWFGEVMGWIDGVVLQLLSFRCM